MGLEVETPSTEICAKDISVETKSPNTVVKQDTAELDITVNRREYSIIGDGLYIPTLYEDAPEWLQNLVDATVELSLTDNNSALLGQMQDLINTLANATVPLNTFTQSILSLSTEDTRLNAVVETLNSNLSDGLSSVNAQIIDVRQTFVSKDEASATIANAISAEIDNGVLSSMATVGDVATAIADETSARAADYTALNAMIGDGLENESTARASAVQYLNTYVGLDENGTPTGIGTLDAIINDIQNQVDGSITSWFETGEPTLVSSPANTWTTDTEKNNHIGDMYYDRGTGYSYRFAYEDIPDDTPDEGIIYSWIRITDTDITKALADAANAQETADGKVTTFYQASAPVAEGIGDIWIDSNDGNKMYRWNGSSWGSDLVGTMVANASAVTELEVELNNGTSTWAQADSTLTNELESKISSSTFNIVSEKTSAELGWTATPIEGVVGSSLACYTDQTYAEALQIAKDTGCRLPTLQEVIDQVGRGTGCGFDNYIIWTQTSPSYGNRWCIQGNGSEATKVIKAETDIAACRFAADVDNSAYNGIDKQIGYVASNFAYDSTLTLNGVSYNSGFGLATSLNQPSAGIPVGTSEFWIKADTLRFTDATTQNQPFSIVNGQTTFNGLVSFSNTTNVPDFATNDDVDSNISTVKDSFTGTNLALEATITSNSAISYVERLTDGDKAIGVPYCTVGGANEWLQFDFGESKFIGQSRIYFYNNDARTYSYKVAYSEDGTTWNYAIGSSSEYIQSRGAIDGLVTIGIECPTIDNINGFGRYFRIYMNGNTSNTANHLLQVEILSSASSYDPYIEAYITHINAKAISDKAEVTAAYKAYTDAYDSALIDGKITDAEQDAIDEAQSRIDTAKAALEANISVVNMANPAYSTFSGSELPAVYIRNCYTERRTDPSWVKYGNATLMTWATAGDAYVYLGSSSSDYNIDIPRNTSLIISVWVKINSGSGTTQLYTRTEDAVHKGTSKTIPLNTWTRLTHILDSGNNTKMIIRIDNDGWNGTNNSAMSIDGVMVERNLTSGVPSPYVAPAGSDSSADIADNNDVFAQSLGFNSYNDMVSNAQLGKTLISGGYINTGLVDADSLKADSAMIKKLLAQNIVMDTSVSESKITSADGSMVIDFKNGSIYIA